MIVQLKKDKMRIAIHELVDRLSILTMKVERLGHMEHKKELKEIKEALNKEKFNCKIGDLLEAVCQMAIANGDTWNLEADIRKGKEKELGLEEVGKRCLKIRDINSKRIEAKNKIGKLTKTGFEEHKIDHRSEK